MYEMGDCAKRGRRLAPVAFTSSLQLDLFVVPQVDHKHVCMFRVDLGTEDDVQRDSFERLTIAEECILLILKVLQLAGGEDEEAAANSKGQPGPS